MTDNTDAKYLSLMLDPIRVSARYKPRFGLRGAGLDLAGFSELYGSDPFYSWVGLDSPLVYAAHKAAGGMTSIYRQLGVGCDRLFRTLLQDTLNLSEEQAKWGYTLPVPGGRTRTLELDGRIDLAHLSDGDVQQRLNEWIQRLREKLEVQIDVRGVVFEVRQGYKSKDSKRQNADLTNAANAYAQRYLPVLTVMSLQFDADLRVRYEGAKWGVLTGNVISDDVCSSTYAFCRDVIGYDLAGFFVRNADTIRSEVGEVIRTLLEPT